MTNIEVSMLTKIDSKPMSHSFTKKNNLRRLVSPQIHSAKLFFFLINRPSPLLDWGSKTNLGRCRFFFGIGIGEACFYSGIKNAGLF